MVDSAKDGSFRANVAPGFYTLEGESLDAGIHGDIVPLVLRIYPFGFGQVQLIVHPLAAAQ